MMKTAALFTTAALVLAICAPVLHAADADAAATSGPARVEIAESLRVQILALVQPTRPAALPVLYSTLVGLQAYDAYSTLRGVSSGAQETNPLVGGLARQSAGFWTIKAVSTASSIYFAEQLWRQHHRAQAVVMMVAANGAMAAIAARNASILARR